MKNFDRIQQYLNGELTEDSALNPEMGKVVATATDSVYTPTLLMQIFATQKCKVQKVFGG